MMNYHDFSLNDWLYELENRHTDEIQLGLDRVKSVASRLNLLHVDTPVILVAGTNGKGSTIAALESIYVGAGYQVASYTSPHLLKFNERIRINQQPISDNDLCKAFYEIQQAQGGAQLTYFEMTTLAALWHFKLFKLDVLCIEVGMGGRLDATNILDIDLPIITTVDLDHQNYLGETIEEIAYEKAGILRPNTPYIYADKEIPKSILLQANLLNAGRIEYSFKIDNEHLKIHPLNSDEIELPLPTIHPNAAAAAIMATSFLSDKLPISISDLDNGLKNVYIKGRKELIDGDVKTIFDVAHNPQSVSLLAKFLDDLEISGKIHAVFSGLKDKDLSGLIKPMKSYVDFWYPALLDSRRAASESLLAFTFKTLECNTHACFKSPSLAYQKARDHAMPGDVIIVYGSFLTVGSVMAANLTESKEFT